MIKLTILDEFGQTKLKQEYDLSKIKLGDKPYLSTLLKDIGIV